MVMVSKVHAFMEVSTDIQGPDRSFSPHLRPVGQHGIMFCHICKRLFAQVMHDEQLVWSRGRRTSPCCSELRDFDLLVSTESLIG